MASLIPGYEYDIFISYRQKDNKYDGWVTEFVDNLKKELEATFKEQVSVYFDINPSDYLLESYDVDASLKDKLKCLVFIPILSRTYCDSKSFAWVHEFKAFVEMASKDQYGLKIKLPNGNVAGRVLPVRIHDLDAADIKECESVLGGVIRGIEFIYKEAGIDKPLASDDDEKKNLNNTKYRIQLIKVAHSIKEIILGMKNEPDKLIGEKEQPVESVKEANAEKIKEAKEKPGKISKVKFLIPLAIIALFIIAGIIAYPKIFKRNTVEKLRASGEKISVVVMPLLNMTNNVSWDIWQTGIQSEIINNLSNLEELRVLQTVAINEQLQKEGIPNSNYTSITSTVASKISKMLSADVFITGSILPAGTILRVNAQLIDSRTKEALKSFEIEGPFKEETVFNMIDSLSVMIRNYLIISKLEKDFEKRTSIFILGGGTKSPEAYRCFLNGGEAFQNGAYQKARIWLLRALSIDSTFILAEQSLAATYAMIQKYDSARIVCNKLYIKKDQLPLRIQLEISSMYSWLNETPNETIKYIMQLLQYDDQDPALIEELGEKYFELNQYENAVREYEKSQKIFDKQGSETIKPWINSRLGIAYHRSGQYKKEKGLLAKEQLDHSNSSNIIQRQAILALTEGDTVAANEFIEKLKVINIKESEASFARRLATIYSEAGILDRAEKYYRKALSLDSTSIGRMNDLAYFLIDKDLNINEGMELIEKALEVNHDSYSYLQTKGWGLFKQGKYKEALKHLQESWDLRMKNALYDHTYFTHLEAAKKTVAGMK